jgi:putative ABC transport system permease protein
VAFKAVLRALWSSPAGPLLLAAQVSFCLMIFANVSYVIFVRFETTGRPTGIDLENIFWIASEGYAKDFDQRKATSSDLAYLNSLSGVIAASASNTVPQTFDAVQTLVSGTAQFDGAQRLAIMYQMTGKAIEALGLHLARGRSFSPDAVREADSPQVPFGSEAVITEALANKLFGSSELALGKPLYFKMREGSFATVVGVVSIMQAGAYFAPDADFINEVILVPGFPSGHGAKYLVRTEPGRRDEIMARVGREFEILQPGRYISRMETLSSTAAEMRKSDRNSAVILAILSSFVLAVTMLGLFGFASFAVTSRTKEIGTRRAIGATKRDILTQFLLENWLITTAGISIGCITTLAFALQLSMLLELPRLPIIFLVSSVVLVWVAGLLAALMPALRGANVPPAVATRVA